MMFELTALVIAVLAALVLGVLGFFRTLGQGPRNERLTALSFRRTFSSGCSRSGRENRFGPEAP